ncbi:SycD/LcrH family type III secretion system chaperone [Candidatus Similichlamydia epinepheli]|uniref:SycD/LcrH family type III secretion system chaperone n=1 Tax=Candidatus Similichlamydia epinepheli TaxID=1903953 RepID=UPI000D36BBC5|nr:SycD/LcrH family type III secretion system chaperone [Candidatus Similichlamydia epinepheli]
MLNKLLSEISLEGGSLDQIRHLFQMFASEHSSTIKDPPLATDEEYEEFSNKIAHAIGLVCEKGIFFKDALGLSNENMEAFYAWGFQFFEKKQFGEALQLFKVLTILDPLQWKYRYAVATTLHRQKNYQDAAKAYITSSMLKPDSYTPLPHYYAADCYIEMQDNYSAIMMLHLCIHCCNPEDGAHVIIRERAELLKQALEEKFSSPIKG